MGNNEINETAVSEQVQEQSTRSSAALRAIPVLVAGVLVIAAAVMGVWLTARSANDDIVQPGGAGEANASSFEIHENLAGAAPAWTGNFCEVCGRNSYYTICPCCMPTQPCTERYEPPTQPCTERHEPPNDVPVFYVPPGPDYHERFEAARNEFVEYINVTYGSGREQFREYLSRTEWGRNFTERENGILGMGENITGVAYEFVFPISGEIGVEIIQIEELISPEEAQIRIGSHGIASGNVVFLYYGNNPQIIAFLAEHYR
jgi:hypothetical protein